jgi:hypothetical protein
VGQLGQQNLQAVILVDSTGQLFQQNWEG